jgi:hypothetical protein
MCIYAVGDEILEYADIYSSIVKTSFLETSKFWLKVPRINPKHDAAFDYTSNLNIILRLQSINV